VIQSSFKGLEDQLVNFVTTGKASFAELAQSILADMSRIAIQQAVIRPLLGATMGLFGIPLPSAKGNVFAQNGVVPFASGGIVDRPTLFKFANGGAGQLGLMGEAGPEAVIPLKRGRDGKLGVSGGGGGSTVVNVSVDAKGTSAQGDGGRGEQLGRAISQAVQAELVKQRRPGGLLAA
jgi:lambda family phage tail tape measure protein